jgi:hypothetical protein
MEQVQNPKSYCCPTPDQNRVDDTSLPGLPAHKFIVFEVRDSAKHEGTSVTLLNLLRHLLYYTIVFIDDFHPAYVQKS